MGGLTEYSTGNLALEAGVDMVSWSRVPSRDEIATTSAALAKRGIRVVPARDRHEALEALSRLIPRGAEVMNGSSTTLAEIGFPDLLRSGTQGWVDLHDRITAENDDRKRAELRRRSVAADYFVSGVNAISRTGEVVACDRTGSRVGAWPFAAGRLILVSGVNKIVPTLGDALRRVREYALPLENARAKRAYGTPSRIGKCVVLVNEEVEGRITLVLVGEPLGY